MASDDLVNPNPEPQKYNQQMLKKGIEWETDEWSYWNIRNRHYVLFNSIPKIKKAGDNRYIH